MPVGLHSKVKVVSPLSQNMRNNFEVVQCTLLDKLIILSLPYFQNVGQVVIMEWTLFWNMGKEEGEAAEWDCNSSNFISMLVCLLFISVFLSFSFCLFRCSFPSSSPLKGTTLVWMEYHIICLCVGVCLFSVDLLCNHSAPAERNFKGRCSRPTTLSYGNKEI